MRQQILHLIDSAIRKLQHDQIIPADAVINPQLERTRTKQNGDFASNVALELAKQAKRKPQELAQLIVNHIGTSPIIETITIAGPGFINFFLTAPALRKIVDDVLRQDSSFGRHHSETPQRINIEFVSANPTGPLHVGHGRGAAFGATMANILEAAGYQVDREYYVNDAGRQMNVLATSVWLRYLSLFHDLPSFPSNGYKGDYVFEIATLLQKQHGDRFVRPIDEVFSHLSKDKDQGGDADIYIDELNTRTQQLLGERDYSLVFDAGIQEILKDIKQDLAEFGVHFDNWFLESSLVTGGDIQRSIDKLRQRGHIYEQDGALWFNATKFGDEKDRVVVRENGLTTYFASDIGYHLNKYERGYDKIIDVFGADHHGYTPRIKAFLQAEGLDSNKVLVLLVQFAILYRGKEKVQMSTRSGEFVTLRQLREEVGNDAARFFYIMRKNDQHLDFDLELAKSQSNDNPVYYIQYAHARICSVMQQLTDKLLSWNKVEGLENLQLLTATHEEKLIRTLQRYAETIETAAAKYEPHLLANYLKDLADDFHSYYAAHQFIVDDHVLRNARLCLINAVKIVIANGLTLLGVSTPESM